MLKILKARLIEWLYQPGDAGFTSNNISPERYLKDLLMHEADCIFIEQSNYHVYQELEKLCPSGYQKQFIKTSDADIPCGTIAISKRYIKTESIKLPSHKKNLDAGNPTIIPTFTIGNQLFLIGTMPQNIHVNLDKQEINQLNTLLEKVWNGAKDSDILAIPVWDKYNNKYDVHTWLKSIPTIDYEYVFDYIVETNAIGIIDDVISDTNKLQTISLGETNIYSYKTLDVKHSKKENAILLEFDL